MGPPTPCLHTITPSHLTALSEELVLALENVEDCNKFLWGDVGSDRVRRSVDRLMEVFALERGCGMRLIMDASMALYSRAVQEVFKLVGGHMIVM